MTASFRYLGGGEWGPGQELEDRLGSKPAGSMYRPYGDNQADYATHSKDATGLHYADQRYYSSQWGRFTSPDPYSASGGTGDPASWNRYSYVVGDPVNFYDRRGLYAEPAHLEAVEYGDSQSGAGVYVWPTSYPAPGGDGSIPGITISPYNPGTPVAAQPAPPPVDALTNSYARSTLGKRLQDFESTNCHSVFQKALAGYSADLLRKTKDRTNFYDVRNPQFGNLTQNDVVRNNDQTTLNNSLPYGYSGLTMVKIYLTNPACRRIRPRSHRPRRRVRSRECPHQRNRELLEPTEARNQRHLRERGTLPPVPLR